MHIEIQSHAISSTEFQTLTETIPAFHPAYLPPWCDIVGKSLNQTVYFLEAREEGKLYGILPLVLMRSLLFGKHLIGLPYVNAGGCLVPESPRREEIEGGLIDEAVRLADRWDVRYLELRNEREISHPALSWERRGKVLMRRELPREWETLWQQLGPKVRNQVRKGEKAGLQMTWGKEDLLSPFYEIFAETMRNVGTPVYPKRLFAEILRQLPDEAEIGVVSMANGRPVAAGLLIHGRGITEVPSAGALRFSHAFCANMFLYWHLLRHSAETRHAQYFDFGRSSRESNTWRFKKQWGAVEVPIVWKYYVRHGTIDDVRPDNAGYSLAIRVWKRLPVWLTKILGPRIVRGIP